MTRKTDATATLLEQLAVLVRKMPAKEVRGVIEGQVELALVERDRAPARPPKRKRLKGGEAIENLIERLHAATTRDDGLRLLDEWHLSNADLRELARGLDAAVRKDDDAERLREKIIEASIGFRLRSDAIRGRSTAESGGNGPS